jgi:SAM-dependent methyltransferase
MTHRGMVHALEEIHRVLTPRGVLADLRPSRWADSRDRRAVLPRVYGVANGEEILVGRLEKENLADHLAADRAVQWVLRRGFFTLQSTETFPFRFYFRTLAVLDDYLSTYWTNSTLSESTRRRLQSLVRERPSSQIAVVDTMRLNVMTKR